MLNNMAILQSAVPLKVVAIVGVVLAAGPALGSQAQSYFNPWNYTQEQFRALPALRQLELHNRCMVAATYAMIDDRYEEQDAKSVYYFHLAHAESLLRAVPYGKRVPFNLNATSVEENKKVYRSLGWTRLLESTITEEMNSCIGISGAR